MRQETLQIDISWWFSHCSSTVGVWNMGDSWQALVVIRACLRCVSFEGKPFGLSRIVASQVIILIFDSGRLMTSSRLFFQRTSFLNFSKGFLEKPFQVLASSNCSLALVILGLFSSIAFSFREEISLLNMSDMIILLSKIIIIYDVIRCILSTVICSRLATHRRKMSLW